MLRQCTNPYDCPFIEYCWKGFPKYSIYAIGSKLGEKKLNELLDKGITQIVDIPDDLMDNEKLSKYHDTIKNNKPYIDKKGIQEELQKIQYPIYFLDYETFGPAIPILDGYRPFQRMVFQYSLHIQRTPDAELEHYEFLAKDASGNLARDLARSLSEHIGKTGTIVVWHKSFEKGCNSEMGEQVPEFAEFFENVNDRIYDLKDVFAKGYYVHKDFMMSNSIKKVLPALVPELSHGILDISEGQSASNSWGDMATKNLPQKQKEKIYNNLLKYCELDTLAMVKILEKLREI